MTSERKPQANSVPFPADSGSPQSTVHEPSALSGPLVCLARFCVARPVSVLALGLILSFAGIYYAYHHLGFKTSRVDLINPKSPFNQLWLEYLEEFGDHDEMIVVVEGKNSTEVVPILDVLSEKISAHPNLFRSVMHGIDISKIRSKGLHYVPTKDLAVIDGFVQESRPIIEGNWSALNIETLLGGMSMRLQMKQQLAALPPGTPIPAAMLPPGMQDINMEKKLDETMSDLDQLSLSLEQWLLPPTPSYGSPWPRIDQMSGSSGAQGGAMHQMPDVVAACSQGNTGYFLIPTDQGVFGFVMLRLASSEKGSFAYGTEAIDKIRSIIAEERARYPEVSIGLTGMIVIENDEMRQSAEAMGTATVLSLIGVAAVFIAALGGFRHPMIAVLAMLIAFGWTIGYVALVIGHLNILSVAFGSILIGLGIDFGIHYVSRYIQLRRTIRSPSEALVKTAELIGPGVVTGALTTAVAFYMAGLAEFTGIAELGIVSGGGILCCCLGAVLLVPAMVMLNDAGRPMRALPRPLNVHGWISPIFRFPKLLLAVSLGITLYLFTGLPHVWYDHNLLNLQAEGEESVELERKMVNLENAGQNVWYALSIADSREQLLRRKAEFEERFPELRVDEIVSWFPAADSEKIPYLTDIASRLAGLPERPSDIPVPDPETLGRLLQQIQMQLAGQHEAIPIIRRLEGIRSWLRGTSSQECAQRIAQYQYSMAGDLLSRLYMLKSMSNPEPPTMNDLPESFVTRFVSKNGKHLMKIYTDADIWNMDEMEQFVKKVRSIDANATGSPLQTYEASKQMQQGYVTAAIYAFIAVFVLLFVDFRSLKCTFLSLTPMLLGLGQMFGILGLLDIPLNPANMIVLPLILGVGIDYGVHVIHDFRLQKDKRFQLSSSTAVSVLITALTTMIGFGALMIASHRGLQSLGRVLVIGISCCLFTSLIVLPAILSWWTAGKEEANEQGNQGQVGTKCPEAYDDGNSETGVERPVSVEPADTLPLPDSGVRRLRRRAG